LLQVPHWSTPPQPSSTSPQFALACEHVRFLQPSGPPSARAMQVLYALLSDRHSVAVADELNDPDEVHLARKV